METAQTCSTTWVQSWPTVPQLSPKSSILRVERPASSDGKLGAGGWTRDKFSGWHDRKLRRKSLAGVKGTVVLRASERPSPPPVQEDSIRPISVVDKDGKLEGVIQVERDATSPRPTWSRIYALGAGDVVFLLLFAAIGRLSHGFSVLDWETVKTADPFIAGWLLGSYFTGGYGPEGQGLFGLKTASFSAVKSWAVGIPVALAIRGFTIGHVPPAPFMVVSLASTLLLQVSWRAAFTALFPNDEKAFQKKMLGNRKGSVFEFFQLLSSLVRRW